MLTALQRSPTTKPAASDFPILVRTPDLINDLDEEIKKIHKALINFIDPQYLLKTLRADPKLKTLAEFYQENTEKLILDIVFAEKQFTQQDAANILEIISYQKKEVLTKASELNVDINISAVITNTFDLYQVIFKQRCLIANLGIFEEKEGTSFRETLENAYKTNAALIKAAEAKTTLATLSTLQHQYTQAISSFAPDEKQANQLYLNAFNKQLRVDGIRLDLIATSHEHTLENIKPHLEKVFSDNQQIHAELKELEKDVTQISLETLTALEKQLEKKYEGPDEIAKLADLIKTQKTEYNETTIPSYDALAEDASVQTIETYKAKISTLLNDLSNQLNEINKALNGLSALSDSYSSLLVATEQRIIATIQPFLNCTKTLAQITNPAFVTALTELDAYIRNSLANPLHRIDEEQKKLTTYLLIQKLKEVKKALLKEFIEHDLTLSEDKSAIQLKSDLFTANTVDFQTKRTAESQRIQAALIPEMTAQLDISKTHCTTRFDKLANKTKKFQKAVTHIGTARADLKSNIALLRQQKAAHQQKLTEDAQQAESKKQEQALLAAQPIQTEVMPVTAPLVRKRRHSEEKPIIHPEPERYKTTFKSVAWGFLSMVTAAASFLGAAVVAGILFPINPFVAVGAAVGIIGLGTTAAAFCAEQSRKSSIVKTKRPQPLQIADDDADDDYQALPSPKKDGLPSIKLQSLGKQVTWGEPKYYSPRQFHEANPAESKSPKLHNPNRSRALSP